MVTRTVLGTMAPSPLDSNAQTSSALSERDSQVLALSPLASFARTNPYTSQKGSSVSRPRLSSSSASSFAFVHSLRQKGLDVPPATAQVTGASVSFPDIVDNIDGGLDAMILDNIPREEDWRWQRPIPRISCLKGPLALNYSYTLIRLSLHSCTQMCPFSHYIPVAHITFRLLVAGLCWMFALLRMTICKLTILMQRERERLQAEVHRLREWAHNREAFQALKAQNMKLEVELSELKKRDQDREIYLQNQEKEVSQLRVSSSSYSQQANDLYKALETSVMQMARAHNAHFAEVERLKKQHEQELVRARASLIGININFTSWHL